MEFNIADLFESLADGIGDRTAVVCGDRRLTYAELDARANRVANFLASRGVKQGDHVGLHLYNSTEFIECMLGAFKLRAVPININYRYVAHELRYLFDNADLVALVTQNHFADKVIAAGSTEKLHTYVHLDAGLGGEVPGGWFEYNQLQADAPTHRDFGPRSGDDLYIVYTGGTTGMPKGVMWRQEDVFFAGLQGGRPGGTPIEKPEELAENASKSAGMTILPAAPFIHGAAQWGALIGLFSGGKLVLQDGHGFDPARVCELIGQEEVTTITLVGDAMARPIAETLATGDYDTKTLRVIASAGAVLSPAVRKKLNELLPMTMVLNSFGASETGHQGSAIPGKDVGVEGRPSFFMDPNSAVLDEDNKPMKPGTGKMGRLARKGRLPLGYYKDPEKTAERFVEIDGERWSIPGDAATLEADGRITVYGRGTNCINTGGQKVFPEEVEEVLKSHPDVFDALVIGLPDDKWMERVVAVVEPRGDARPSLEELQTHCREKLAGFKVPRQLTVVDKVARQPSGKPDYAWAKERAQAEE